jgi:hypothetical protein
MENDKEQIERNIPSEDGRRNDPDLRDESAIQPGVQTISSAPNDDANQHLTKTATGHFDEDTEFGKNADKAFDEVGDNDKD